ncbi:hypothetical protein ABZW32_30905 [Streptomyces sp. NPDC004667]|uniref:hypothetical protein n=1 Tax=Streptomyces sp. NPDC004667 TaxID=3154285 RepID=UPI0033BB8DE8
MNETKRLGLAALGALLAGGLLLAACADPDVQAPPKGPGDAVLPHRGDALPRREQPARTGSPSSFETPVARP